MVRHHIVLIFLTALGNAGMVFLEMIPQSLLLIHLLHVTLLFRRLGFDNLKREFQLALVITAAIWVITLAFPLRWVPAFSPLLWKRRERVFVITQALVVMPYAFWNLIRHLPAVLSSFRRGIFHQE